MTPNENTLKAQQRPVEEGEHTFICGDSVHQSIIERTERRTREGWYTFSVLMFGIGMIIGAVFMWVGGR